MKGTYFPILGSCITLHMRKCLVNAVATLVADIILLITMLIGLLRHAQRSSTGIWPLLYQQVMLYLFLAPEADILQVHHVDSLGGTCGSPTCRLSVSPAQ